MKNKPIAIGPRAAADLRQLLEQAQRINDRLNIYVEAIGAALDVAPGWRFDVQTMAFLPPQEQREIPGLDPEFVRTHEGVFCGAPAGEQTEQPEMGTVPADDVSIAVEE